jgi:hypothetical protein
MIVSLQIIIPLARFFSGVTVAFYENSPRQTEKAAGMAKAWLIHVFPLFFNWLSG